MPEAVSASDILDALALGESIDWEFKSAKGGVPGSLWETYGAMANTDGGAIVMGIAEGDDGFVVQGLTKVPALLKSFWDTVNDRGKVSTNLLSDSQVRRMQVKGREVVVVEVPRAGRRDRPVFVGQNPLTGTYRRNNEGDYHCTQQEVGRMLADRGDEPADSRILDGFGLADLDTASLQQYRNRFSAVNPGHVWLSLTDQELLEKLGGWRTDRATRNGGLTVAGLLMFGKDEAIRDPSALPRYHVDYQLRFSDDPVARWDDRIYPDGTWAANVFQFYHRVLPKLTSDLPIPFRLGPDLFRADDTPVHEALREAMVNALIHADYCGIGGIRIVKRRAGFEMENPGTLLVSTEQILRGGVSECRNKALQTMFQMIGGGEKAGSGFDKIRHGWSSQEWRRPYLEEMVQPDRVRLLLRMESLLPEDSVARLRARFGSRMSGLSPLEMQALAAADALGYVSNSVLQGISDTHPADITKVLRGLVLRGLLAQEGQKRATRYLLAAAGSPQLSPASQAPAHGTVDIAHSTVHIAQSGLDMAQWPVAATPSARRQADVTRQAILEACRGRYLTADQIAQFLGRNRYSAQGRFVRPMVRDGLLLVLYPDQPRRRDQAYTTNDAASDQGDTQR